MKRGRGIMKTFVWLLAGSMLASCQFSGGHWFSGSVLPELRPNTSQLHVALLGDTGTGDAAQQSVGAALAAAHHAQPYQFVGLLGDNFYPAGVAGPADPQFQTDFEVPYPAAVLSIPFYVVMGNHDYLGNVNAEYGYSDGRWLAREGAFLVPVVLSGGLRIDFYFVDSELLMSGQKTALPIIDWVRETIAFRPSAYRLLLCHRPLYSSGAHGDTAYLLDAFQWALDQGVFSAYIAGHDHDLELQARDPNQDGRMEVFAVSGAGSQVRPIIAGAQSVISESALGYLDLTISSNGADFQFLNVSGTPLGGYHQTH